MENLRKFSLVKFRMHFIQVSCWQIFILLSFFFMCVLRTSTCFSQPAHYHWRIGEELIYRVTWMNIRIASVKLQVCDTLRIHNTLVYHTRFQVVPNPRLFFVNIHSTTESYIDEYFRPHFHITDEKEDGIHYNATYTFDYADSIIHIVRTDKSDTSHIVNKRLPLSEPIFEGMSLLYYARSTVHRQREECLTALIDGEKREITFFMKGAGKKMEIKKLDRTLDTYEMEAFGSFASTAGVGGRFRAWFAVDEQAPPLEAEMKVFLGKVKVSLESWNHRQDVASMIDRTSSSNSECEK